MKKTILFLFLFLPLLSLADDGCTPVYSDSVLAYPGKTADQLYSNLKYWVTQNFKSSNVLQLDDQSTHHLVCKGVIPLSVANLTWHALSGYINFTVDLQARDGRARIKILNFEHESTSPQYSSIWSMGTIYTVSEPSCIKKSAHRAYRKMHEYSIPLINNAISYIYTSLSKMDQTEDEEW